MAAIFLRMRGGALAHPSDYDLIRFARLSNPEHGAMREILAHVAACADCATEIEVIEDWLSDASVPDEGVLRESLLARRVRASSRSLRFR
jgi:hypothetical protein